MMRPMREDIDRIRSEVNRQTSLCQCSKKYDVEQIAEGRYRVSRVDEEKNSNFVRSVRRNSKSSSGSNSSFDGDGSCRWWLDDPRRIPRSSRSVSRCVLAFRLLLHVELPFLSARGRTNCELHPDVYALREGVAQTMSLFKTKARPSSNHHFVSARRSFSSNDDLSFSSQLISESREAFFSLRPTSNVRFLFR